MLKSLISLCNWFKWFILGEKKAFLKKRRENSQLNKRKGKNRVQPSASRVNKKMINAGSNMGLMEDAVECWNNLPSKTKYLTIKDWKERYSEK